jgi:hypothetical protein
VRVARDRRGRGEAAAARVALDEVGEPRRARGGCHERVEVVVGEHLVDAFGARKPAVGGERVEILLRIEAALLLRVDEVLLPEVRHHLSLCASLNAMMSARLCTARPARIRAGTFPCRP